MTKSPADILIAEMGKWQWGIRDCITALQRWTAELTPSALPEHLVQAAHSTGHVRAIARYQHILSGAASAYCDAIALSKGYKLLPSGTSPIPSDLMVIRGPVWVFGQETPCDTVAFVDDTCSILVRASSGFIPMDGHKGIIAHYRPRA